MHTMEHRSPTTLKEKLTAAAKRGELIMRPRWHFALKAALVAVGALLAAFALLSVVSFLVFWLRQTGVWFAPGFGARGWFGLMRNLPWIMVLLAAIFMVILEVLVRRFSFTYRRPLVYSVLGVVLLGVVGGALAAPIHRGVFLASRLEPPPVIGPLYRDLRGARLSDVRRGIVLERQPGFLVIEESSGATTTIIVTRKTRLPFGADFDAGDTVVVMGDVRAGGFEAFGIRELFEEDF